MLNSGALLSNLYFTDSSMTRVPMPGKEANTGFSIKAATAIITIPK